ncbi:UDP-N-acetylglucosamine 2-epimerase [candidate division KSB1 bacterium]|nr:UDP-N-acetylglucosamine 2-epimerase [candidate division KSB1 bacterium]
MVSVHREENVDLPERLRMILEIFKELEKTYDKPVIVSTHPRTRKRLEALGVNLDNERTRFLKPFGFCDFVQLQQKAFCTISDSGTISEESAILNFPAITLRNSMERPEALDAGTIALTGFDTQTVLASIEIAVREHDIKKQSKIPADYQVPDTSRRVLRLIAGTCKLSNHWLGIEGM